MIILHFHLQPQFKMNYFIYTSHLFFSLNIFVCFAQCEICSFFESEICQTETYFLSLPSILHVKHCNFIFTEFLYNFLFQLYTYEKYISNLWGFLYCTKPWRPEIFMECHCVVRWEEPTRYWKTKQQATLEINLWFWGFLTSFISICHNSMNIPKMF